MEAHGAANVWIAGHWSILVTKPEYLLHVFRNEHVIAKAGFRTKLPWVVQARYFGESVINAHGQTWHLMRQVVQPALNRPIDGSMMKEKTTEMIAVLKQGQSTPLDKLVQQWTMAVFGHAFLDIDFGIIGDCQSPLYELCEIHAQMRKCFPSPLFDEFPILQKFPWLFRSTQAAFDKVDRFERFLLGAIEDLVPEMVTESNKFKLIYRLREARQAGSISEYQYRSNVKNLFAAGHENVERTIMSLIWELAEHQAVQSRLREEIDLELPNDYAVSDLKRLPVLAAVVYEILRLYPPIFHLTNRVTREDTRMGDIPIPAGVYIGWNAYGVHTNPRIWGPDAHVFRPERWGHKVQDIHEMWRLQQVKGNCITFNAYKRKCLGASFAVTQIMMCMCEMVRQLTWTRDPSYKLRLATVSLLFALQCDFI
jgi:unspecific monooxygenase